MTSSWFFLSKLNSLDRLMLEGIWLKLQTTVWLQNGCSFSCVSQHDSCMLRNTIKGTPCRSAWRWVGFWKRLSTVAMACSYDSWQVVCVSHNTETVSIHTTEEMVSFGSEQMPRAKSPTPINAVGCRLIAWLILLAPRIWSSLPDLWKICVPMVCKGEAMFLLGVRTDEFHKTYIQFQ